MLFVCLLCSCCLLVCLLVGCVFVGCWRASAQGRDIGERTLHQRNAGRTSNAPLAKGLAVKAWGVHTHCLHSMGVLLESGLLLGKAASLGMAPDRYRRSRHFAQGGHTHCLYSITCRPCLKLLTFKHVFSCTASMGMAPRSSVASEQQLPCVAEPGYCEIECMSICIESHPLCCRNSNNKGVDI